MVGLRFTGIQSRPTEVLDLTRLTVDESRPAAMVAATEGPPTTADPPAAAPISPFWPRRDRTAHWTSPGSD